MNNSINGGLRVAAIALIKQNASPLNLPLSPAIAHSPQTSDRIQWTFHHRPSKFPKTSALFMVERPHTQKLVLEWATLYQQDLLQMWNTQEFRKLPPLK